MKRFGYSLLLLGFLTGAAPTALAEPLPTLTVRGFDDLEKAVARLGKIFDAEGKFNLRNEMKGALGLTDATFDQALDLTKPWQVAVWYEMPNPPLISLKIPAKDLDQFKASLIAEGMLSAQAKQWTALDGGMISISMLPAEAMAESQKAELQAWQSAALARPSPTVEFSTRLNEILRAQGLAGLKIAEAAMTANMPTNSAPGMPFDAKLMSRVFAVYFDVIETVLQGLKEYRVGLDITEEALVAEDHISAKDGTVLAQWLAKPRHALSASMRRLADPGALMAFAGGLGKDTNQLALLNQFMALGFQMQNVAADDPVIARIQEFFEALLPMTFAASVTAEKGLSFGGAYAFPEQGAAKAYGEIKRFMKNDMAALVGPDKMYASSEFQDAARTISGVAVDRVLITLNTNSGIFAMPGQKEQLLAMWPGGLMEFDYALLSDVVLFGSPNRMEGLIALAKSGNAPAGTFAWDDTTAFAGYVSPIQFMEFSMVSNPMIPKELKIKFTQLKAEGTSVEFRVNLNGQWHSSARLPLRLFEELRKLGDE